MKKPFHLLLTVVLLAFLGISHAQTPTVTSLGEKGDIVINEIFIEGFSAPVWGEHPDYDMYADEIVVENDKCFCVI